MSILFPAKICGTDEWGKDIHSYTTMSTAESIHAPGKKLITASTEAFAYAYYDNNLDKWQATCEYYRDEGDYNKKIPDKKDEKNERYYKAKYTSMESGHKRFGTFSDEGLEVFNKVRHEIKTIRETDDDVRASYYALEIEFLTRYRASKGLVAKSAKEEKKLKSKKRKAGDGGEKTAPKKRIWTWDSDEE